MADSRSRAPEDALDVERAAARASRSFHERIVRPAVFEDRRSALALLVTDFYERRLRIRPTAGQRRSLQALSDPNSLAVEIAHDGQLPHLGIVRMVFKAREIGAIDGRGVPLYLIGTHYAPSMRPDNLHFGMPLEGTAPDRVREPPRIPLPPGSRDRPFRSLPPPTAEDLSRLASQLREYVGHNLHYARSRGGGVRPGDRERILARLDDLFRTLTRDAAQVSNFGDWLIRVQHDLFTSLLGEEENTVLFVPMAELAELLREDLTTVARSVRTRSRDRAGGPDGKDAGGFWLYCPNCFRRQRLDWGGEENAHLHCPKCGHEASLEGPGLWRWLFPDVVSFGAAIFRLGIDGWVVGSPASYHPQIDAAYRGAFGLDAPPRFILASVPTFTGLGEPPEGFGKTRLLRALLEVEPTDLAERLSAPWDDNPRIVSEFLARAPPDSQ